MRRKCLCKKGVKDKGMVAEGVGFEPTEHLSMLNGFQDRRIRPLCHPSEANYTGFMGGEGVQ